MQTLHFCAAAPDNTLFFKFAANAAWCNLSQVFRG
jgi:hypothetical protein